MTCPGSSFLVCKTELIIPEVDTRRSSQYSSRALGAPSSLLVFDPRAIWVEEGLDVPIYEVTHE